MWECFGRSIVGGLESADDELSGRGGGGERARVPIECTVRTGGYGVRQGMNMMKRKTVKNIASMYGRIDCKIPSQRLVFTVD